MRWAGEEGNKRRRVGRGGRTVNRKAAEWKEGRGKEGRYITVRGFRGLGRALVFICSQTHQCSELTACSGATCHITSRERDCDRGEGTAEPVQQLT